MSRATRCRLTTAATALIATTVLGAASAAAARPALTPVEPVAFETVATVDTVGTAGLARGVAIRSAGPDDLWRLGRIFDDAPSDPTHPTGPGAVPTGELVMGAIADAYPDSIPSDSVLLVGLVSGCNPAPAVVRSGGEVMLVDGGSDPGVLCVVSSSIVAVVEVAAADVPVGGADRATLQRFGFIGYEPILPASDGELPPLAEGDRRITAVVTGCRDTTAELVVSASVVEAVAKTAHDEPDYDCAQAEFFVATFDIAAELIPETAELPSTTDR